MLRQITLILDEEDYATIQAEFARRQLCRDKHGVVLPEGESNLAGAMLAECVRDCDDYAKHWTEDHGPDGEEPPHAT